MRGRMTMIEVYDSITERTSRYDDIEDFRESMKFSFDESVHDVIDELADAFKVGKPVQEFEAYLAIEIAEV